MKKILTLIILLVFLIGCVQTPRNFGDLRTSKQVPLPPPPTVPGMTTAAGVAVGKATPSWASAWAATPTGISLTPLTSDGKFDKVNPQIASSITGYDLVWSQGYYTNVRYILQQLSSGQTLDATEVWKTFDIKKPDGTPYFANGGWIQVARTDRLSATVPANEFEVNTGRYNSVVLFGCNNVGLNSGYVEYNCNGVDGLNVKVRGDNTLTTDSGRGSWMLQDFEVSTTQLLPSAPSAPTGTTFGANPAWAALPTGISLSPLTSTGTFDKSNPTLTTSLTGYDYVWSQGYYTDTTHILSNLQNLVPTSVWKPFNVKKADGTTLTTPGWIQVAQSTTLNADVPSASFEINTNKYNAVALFACKSPTIKDGFVEFNCNGVDSKPIKVKGDNTPATDSGQGSWLLKNFDLTTTTLLPPSPTTPGTTTQSSATITLHTSMSNPFDASAPVPNSFNEVPFATCNNVALNGACTGQVFVPAYPMSISGVRYEFSAKTSVAQVPIKQLVLKKASDGTIKQNYLCPTTSADCKFQITDDPANKLYSSNPYILEAKTVESCIPETNNAFCTRLQKTCGTVTANDNCGASRTVTSCGTCSTGTCTNNNCLLPATADIQVKHSDFATASGWTVSNVYPAKQCANNAQSFSCSTDALSTADRLANAYGPTRPERFEATISLSSLASSWKITDVRLAGDFNADLFTSSEKQSCIGQKSCTVTHDFTGFFSKNFNVVVDAEP